MYFNMSFASWFVVVALESKGRAFAKNGSLYSKIVGVRSKVKVSSCVDRYMILFFGLVNYYLVVLLTQNLNIKRIDFLFEMYFKHF